MLRIRQSVPGFRRKRIYVGGAGFELRHPAIGLLGASLRQTCPRENRPILSKRNEDESAWRSGNVFRSDCGSVAAKDSGSDRGSYRRHSEGFFSAASLIYERFHVPPSDNWHGAFAAHSDHVSLGPGEFFARLDAAPVPFSGKFAQVLYAVAH